MTRWMIRITVLMLVVVLALGVVPATAARATPGIFYSNGYWYAPCSSPLGGAFSFDIDVYVPANHTVKAYWIWTSPSGDHYFENKWVQTTTWIDSDTTIWVVPADGSVEWKHEVYDLKGTLISCTRAYANCVTGETLIQTCSIFSILPPHPSARVQALVLYDTPVFSVPSPDAALPDTLLAGQEWFVVGEVTGTDGNLWYEVFVGGPHNAYVPAAALSLPGPIP